MDEKEFEVFVTEIEKDANKNLAEFETDVEKKIDKVSHFNVDNFDELFKMILDNCQDLTDLEYYTDILRKRIYENGLLKEKLLYQKGLSAKDIIYENIIKIYLIYNIMLATVWVSSSDMLVFIRTFLISFMIGASTFWANLKYFTSPIRKKQIDNTVIELDRMNKINLYDISVFNKFRSMYLNELRYEVGKLYEINQDNNIDDINRILEGLKIDFLIDNKRNKSRIRKK